jgi:serine/threonine-protein kinase
MPASRIRAAGDTFWQLAIRTRVTHNDLAGLQTALGTRFRIRSRLGRGGASFVFLADDVAHSRTVAMKVLRPDNLTTISGKRFRREIDLATQLRHPNVLPVLEVGEVVGCPYFVMPAVDGGSLYDLLERERALAVPRALAIARAIADGLDYAHRQNVIHRDIKPANILFHEGRPVIADFGAARAVDQTEGERLSAEGVAIGTLAYMSPEQASAERELDGRTDVYSLGCVVFEMLTGRVPFGGRNTGAIMSRELLLDAPSSEAGLPVITPEMQRVIDRALARERTERFATAGEFVDALERAN